MNAMLDKLRLKNVKLFQVKIFKCFALPWLATVIGGNLPVDALWEGLLTYSFVSLAKHKEMTKISNMIMTRNQET